MLGLVKTIFQWPPQSIDKCHDLGALYKLAPIFIAALLPAALLTPDPQPKLKTFLSYIPES